MMAPVDVSLPGEVGSIAAARARRPFLISLPDAERISVQSRFVKNRFEAAILTELESRILGGTIIDPAEVPADLVTINSRVLLRHTAGAWRRVITLVLPSCLNRQKGHVSVLTPLGSILLGARTGDHLTGPFPAGVATAVVESILHQPEAAGDYYG